MTTGGLHEGGWNPWEFSWIKQVASTIRVIKTAIRAPNMNAICERFFGSLRRECLDHIIVLNDRHFDRVVQEYVTFHNEARPHQALRQQTPVLADRPSESKIIKFPVLGGLHEGGWNPWESSWIEQVAGTATFYNEARPHQAFRHQTPVPADQPFEGKIIKFPVLGGLHQDYRRAA